MSRLERQPGVSKSSHTRLYQYEKKRSKVSHPQQGHHHCHDDPVVLSPIMESVPVTTPYHMPQAATSRATVVEVQCCHLFCTVRYIQSLCHCLVSRVHYGLLIVAMLRITYIISNWLKF